MCGNQLDEKLSLTSVELLEEMNILYNIIAKTTLDLQR